MSDRIALSAFAQPALFQSNVWRNFAHAVRVTLTRRELRALDHRLLEDIGVSQAEALREAARAPWDLEPARRRR